MSQARILAIAFIVIGALLAVASALADQVGLGAPLSTFGWKQLLGLIFGIILLVAGVILLRQGDEPYEDEEDEEEFLEGEGEEADVATADAMAGAADVTLTADDPASAETTVRHVAADADEPLTTEGAATAHDTVSGAETRGPEAGATRRVVTADDLRDDPARGRS